MKRFKKSDINSKVFNKGNKILFFEADGICPCIPAKNDLGDIEKSFQGEIEFYEYTAKKVKEINKDEIITHFEALPLPTTLFIKDGKIIDRLVGDNSKSTYRNYANKLLDEK